jgi:glycosyltransferase involved in cell wall biosynthesis
VVETDKRPLVTFALFAYNQADFIREAVEGALAQDYRPLHIIISDDCSSDETFAVASQLASLYQGEASLELNRNRVNVGLADHINRVMAMVRGEFVVVAAGDDISNPRRTSALVDEWLSAGRPATSIFSAMNEIDRASQLSGREYRSSVDWKTREPRDFLDRNLGVFGASQAWCMSIVRTFPPMQAKIVNEDHVIPFRAVLGGARVMYVDKVLVSYRANFGIASLGGMSSTLINRRSPSIVYRPYCVTVQKSADITFQKQHVPTLKRLARKRRAEYLFRFRLAAKRKFSWRQLIFFGVRARILWIVRELALQLVAALARATR